MMTNFDFIPSEIIIWDPKDGENTYKLTKSNKLGIHKVNKKITESRTRRKGKEFRATVDHAIDPKTRSLLNKLLNTKTLSKIYGSISTGKESIVYHAINAQEEHFALKIFKTTILDFKNRDIYIKGEHRFERAHPKSNRRKMVKLWAEKEFRNLKRIHSAKINCPKPILLRENILVMSYIGSNLIPAKILKEIKFKNEDVTKKLYKDCMMIMHKLYNLCKLVHGDLSEYNLLYLNESIYVIDVSQSVQLDHLNAHEFLLKDCSNINKFFFNRGINTFSNKDLFNYVINKVDDPNYFFEKEINKLDKENNYYSKKDLEKENSEIRVEVTAPKSLFEIDEEVKIDGDDSVLERTLQKLTIKSEIDHLEEYSDVESGITVKEDKHSVMVKVKKKFSKEEIKELRKMNKKEVKIAQREKRKTKVPKKVKKRKEKLIKMRKGGRK